MDGRRLRAVPAGPLGTDADGLPTENAPRRSRARPRRTFDAECREPKLRAIFVHDERGRMDSDTLATVEDAFEGPDLVAELITMKLHRLGAGRQRHFLGRRCDVDLGWDRVLTIVALAVLKLARLSEVLENCHAAQHVSQALTALGLNDRERLPLFRKLRPRLRAGIGGRWRGHWRNWPSKDLNARRCGPRLPT